MYIYYILIIYPKISENLLFELLKEVMHIGYISILHFSDSMCLLFKLKSKGILKPE